MQPRILLPALLLLTLGCSRPEEPIRTVPDDWKTWEGLHFSFRYPSDVSVTVRSSSPEETRIVVTRKDATGKLILSLDEGEDLQFPSLHASKGLPTSSTRIGSNNVDRVGPISRDASYVGECLLKPKGKACQIHTAYTQLDPSEQDMAETLIASIRVR